MKINKALVKHETRNMKWMLIYFSLIAIAGILFFNAGLNRTYMEILSGGLNADESVIMYNTNRMFQSIILPMGIGILLMIYLQFKDSKSIEVGNFLKALPISNTEYYTTKLIGGLISLIIPTIILITGILLVRNNNMIWISDIHSISLFQDLIIKSDSIINVTAALIMSSLVAIATYTFLFMMQYIVTNIVAGLVIGCLVWLSSTFLLAASAIIYGSFLETIYIGFNDILARGEATFVNYVEPWFYPTNMSYLDSAGISKYNAIFDNIHFVYYKGLGIKIAITLIISIVSIIIGYSLSTKSKVEDNDALISFKWARKLFIIGVTVCSAFLLAVIAQIFLGQFNSLGIIIVSVVLIIGGIIGFIVSKKMTQVKSK